MFGYNLLSALAFHKQSTIVNICFGLVTFHRNEKFRNLPLFSRTLDHGAEAAKEPFSSLEISLTFHIIYLYRRNISNTSTDSVG